MGGMNSKDGRSIPYFDMITNLVEEMDFWVLINGKRYKLNACIQNEREICLEINRRRSKHISYEDIIATEIAQEDGNESCNNGQLIIFTYPVIKKRRRFVRITLSFSSIYIVQRANEYISSRILAQRAPHLPPAVIRKHRRLLVIVNPFSGRKRALKLWKIHVVPILETANVNYDLISTVGEKHAVEIAKNLKLDEYDAVAIVSGDGLVLEVISGFLMRKDRERALKMPLAHIPGGTSNGLAASICFQCNEPFPPRGVFCTEMALMVVRPRYLPLRISHAQTEHDGDKAMFMSLSWGLIADIDIGSERFRWAGMARLHMEAFLRVMTTLSANCIEEDIDETIVDKRNDLPEVAHYKARISYLPVQDDSLKSSVELRHGLQRENYTEGHFNYTPVEDFTTCRVQEETNVSDVFESADLVQMPALSEPVGSDWVVLEGFFVYVCLTTLSHIGSDIPYLPCARMDDEFLYLTYTDWNGIKSRLEFARMLLGMDDCSHLAYSFLQIIPVRACRVEPLDHCGGYAAVDGEPITAGSAFQVVPTRYCATVIGRNERRC